MAIAEEPAVIDEPKAMAFCERYAGFKAPLVGLYKLPSEIVLPTATQPVPAVIPFPSKTAFDPKVDPAPAAIDLPNAISSVPLTSIDFPTTQALEPPYTELPITVL